MGKIYKVFFIYGYESQVGTDLLNSVEFQVIAETEDQAMEKAKQIVKKQNYRLFRVVEKHHGT